MMKAGTLIKVNIMRRTLFAVLLLLTFLFAFSMTARPSFAADTYELSGQYTLDSNYTDVTKMPDAFEPATFDLYLVGEFVSGPPYARLLPQYEEKQIGPIPLRMDGEDEVVWTKRCLEYANTLSNYVPDSPDYQINVDEHGVFSISGLANGIYLLKGDSQLIHDYPEKGKSSYWWPQPMLISILDGDEEISVKPMTELVSHLMVHKVWENENGKQEEVRPESVTVKIYYDTKDETGLRFTEILNEDNNWCFSWDPAKGEGDPSKWMVEEVTGKGSADRGKLMHYTVSIGTNFVKDKKGDKQVITITNTYCPPPTTTTTTSHDKAHKTGDTFDLTKTIVLMVMALLVLILTLLGRRKRRNER